jgi:hypothetical protein
MAAVVIDGTTYTDGTTLDYTVSGRYTTDVRIGARKYEIAEESANGLDGYGTKNFGAREQDIQLEIYYVDTSESGILSGWVSDTSGLAQTGTFTVSVAGISLGTCRLVSEKCSISQVRKVGRTGAGGATYRASAVLVLKRLR